MKKFIILAIAAFLVFTGCNYPDSNKGYGYDQTPVQEQTAPPVEIPQTGKKGYVKGPGKYGDVINICTAYFGEFNGHTWYVFYDNLAVPAVVHDPLCECNK